jgi:L-fuconate dehydratase
MSGGPSEILSVILMCLKKNVKVVPHAGGVGLCEYVRQYSFIDYICFSADMTGRLCEATAHLHEHFEEPIIFRNRPSDNMQCYMPNLTPGFGTMIRESIDDWAFPYGKHWNDVEKIGEDLD